MGEQVCILVGKSYLQQAIELCVGVPLIEEKTEGLLFFYIFELKKWSFMVIQQQVSRMFHFDVRYDGMQKGHTQRFSGFG